MFPQQFFRLSENGFSFRDIYPMPLSVSDRMALGQWYEQIQLRVQRIICRSHSETAKELLGKDDKHYVTTLLKLQNEILELAGSEILSSLS